MASTSDDATQNTIISPSSCAQNRSVDPHLAAVVNAWCGLSDPVKAAVMALVKAVVADD